MAVEERVQDKIPAENPLSEVDVRIAALRQELAELYALQGEQRQQSAQNGLPSPELPQDSQCHDRQQTPALASFLRRLFTASDAGLRQLLRSPTALLSDVEHYLSRSKHQPRQWQTGTGGRIAVENRLQDVWPLNVDVRPNLSPTLNVLLPSLQKRDLTGGPNTALNLTARLAARGVPVRYLVTDRDYDADESFLREHLQAVSGVERRLDNVQFVSGRDRSRAVQIGEHDVMCGSAWWTVQMIQDIQPRLKSRRFWYLIQDFEPGMYAWSTKQALALETYRGNFQAIICSRLLADYLTVERIGRFAEAGFTESCLVFEPAVDPQRFSPQFESVGKRKKRLLFYARPQTPRNLFELGLVALKQAVERGAFCAAEWELGFLGGDLPTADLGRGVMIGCHPWRNYDAYADLLRNTDVGLSLMLSPHTSYPPLEMAACGATVVTNTYAVKTSSRLQQISENLLPVRPCVEAIVEGLLAAARRAENLPERFAGAVLDVPPDWDAALEPLMLRLLAIWQECRGQ